MKGYSNQSRLQRVTIDHRVLDEGHMRETIAVGKIGLYKIR